jgi:hypothetical protein
VAYKHWLTHIMTLFLYTKDCDDDDDCDFGLVCFKRSFGQQDVPGCSGNADTVGDSDEDFCIKPPTSDTLVLMGDASETRSDSAFPLGECQGDCDSGKLELT